MLFVILVWRFVYCATLMVSLGPRGGSVSNFSPAVTLDYSRRNDSSHVLSIDLENTKLLTLAKGLSGGILRIGGSAQDSIQYDLDGSCVPGQGYPGGSPNYVCSQDSCGVHAYGCFTGERFRELLRFGRATGLQIVFGLNGCNGRTGPNSTMDFTNLVQFLNYTAWEIPTNELSNLFGFEFANERITDHILPWRWAKDVQTLKGLLQDLFAAAGKSAPPILGPDNNRYPPFEKLHAYLPRGVLSKITYHQYPNCAPNLPSGTVLDIQCLWQLDTVAEEIVDIFGDYGVEIWSGEGAAMSASHEAQNGLYENTFASSFYYAWQQGALPLKGVSLTARQTLVGANYGLLNSSTFDPQPDYYIAWMFRSLFNKLGGSVYSIHVKASSSTGETGLRVFAFGGAIKDVIIVIAVNMHLDQSYTLVVDGVVPDVAWVVESADEQAGVFSRTITINGVPIIFKGALPNIQSLGKALRGANINAPATSIVFASASTK